MDREKLGRLVRATWEQWARENPVKCETCSGRGYRFVLCDACNDSTWDHECPPSEDCDDCNGTGKRVKPSLVTPWDALTEPEREVDRLIADAVARAMVDDIAAAFMARRDEWRKRGVSAGERRDWDDSIACEARVNEVDCAIALLISATKRIDAGVTPADLAGLAAREGGR